MAGPISFTGAPTVTSVGSIRPTSAPTALDGGKGGPYGPPILNTLASTAVAKRVHAAYRSRYAECHSPGLEGQWEEAGVAGDRRQGCGADRPERPGHPRNPVAAGKARLHRRR